MELGRLEAAAPQEQAADGGCGGGGATPARERRRGLAGEVQGGERNPFRGSIGAEEGRNGGSTELRRRPAMVAMAGGLAGHARGAGLCPL